MPIHEEYAHLVLTPYNLEWCLQLWLDTSVNYLAISYTCIWGIRATFKMSVKLFFDVACYMHNGIVTIYIWGAPSLCAHQIGENYPAPMQNRRAPGGNLHPPQSVWTMGRLLGASLVEAGETATLKVMAGATQLWHLHHANLVSSMVFTISVSKYFHFLPLLRKFNSYLLMNQVRDMNMVWGRLEHPTFHSEIHTDPWWPDPVT